MKNLKLLLLLLLYLDINHIYSQEHPFLIIKESMYSDIQDKLDLNQQPFKLIKETALAKWDKDGNLSERLNYNMIAYIIKKNSNERIKFKETILNVIKDWAKEALKLSPKNHGYVAGSSIQFNAIIAMDIIHNDLTNKEKKDAEESIELVAKFYTDNNASWKLAQYGVNLLYAIYKRNPIEIKYWKSKYDNYLFKKSLTKDGSWGQSPNYAFARMHGNRMAKTCIIDVLEFTGLGEYYDNPKMHQLFEWSTTFGVTPFGGYTKFGDSGRINRIVHTSTNLFYANKYNSTIGGMAYWHLNHPRSGVLNPLPNNKANLFISILKSNINPSPIMPVSLLKKQSGAALWDQNDSKEALQGILYSLKRDNQDINNFGHNFEDTNSFDLVAYGEHLVMNSGVRYTTADGLEFNYPGFTPDGDRWSKATLHNTVLIGDEVSHKQKDGNGLIDGIVDEKIEFATTDAGPAIDNGTHKRTLHLIQPILGRLNGYFAIYDKVIPINTSDSVTVNFQVNTRFKKTNIVSVNEEYLSNIDAAVTRQNNSKKVTLFFTSNPSVSISGSYKGIFDSNIAIKSDNVRAKYKVRTDDSSVRATTIIFPQDSNHDKADISKITNKKYDGAQIAHNDTLKDYYIGANYNDDNFYNNINFKANITFFRKELLKTIVYSSTKGTKFLDTENINSGYESELPISIVMEGNSGTINSKDDTYTTFYKENISKVKINNQIVSNCASGLNYVEVLVPKGRSKIELITDKNTQTTSTTISIIDPIKRVYKVGDDLTVNVSAIDNKGIMDNVKLFLNDRLIKKSPQDNVNIWWKKYDPYMENLQEGKYTIRIVATNSMGTSKQITKKFKVGKYPTITLLKPSKTRFNIGDDLTVSVKFTDNNDRVDLFFDNQIVTKSREKNTHIWWKRYDPLMENLQEGKYTIKILATNSIGLSTEKIMDIVVGAPKVNYLQPFKDNFNVGDDLTVSVEVDDNEYNVKSVELFFDDEFVKKSGQKDTHIWWKKYDPLMANLQKGKHTLRVRAVDNSGLSTEVTKDIVVGAPEMTYIQPFEDNFNVGNHPTISGYITDKEDSLNPVNFKSRQKAFKKSKDVIDISFYPNPVSSKGQITIDLGNTINTEINILDLYGRKIYKTKTNVKSFQIELNPLQIKSGIYFLEILENESKPYRKKIIIIDNN